MAARVVPIVAALAAAALAAGCTLYTGTDEPPRDAWIVFPDAAPPIDAEPEECQEACTCQMSLPCPAPDPSRLSVCGRLLDVVDDRPVRAEGAVGGPCMPGGSWPCGLRVTFHDALAYATDPTGPPLEVEAFALDDCGRFVARNIRTPQVGFLAVVVEDPAGAARPTWTAFPVQAGARRNGQRAHVLRTSTDAAWTTAAGLTGATVAERGAVLMLFRAGGSPAPGVRVTIDGRPDPARDYYFLDADPARRTTPSAATTVTGPSGAALVLGSSLVPHGGTGGEPMGCRWESELAASVPGTLMVTPRHALAAQGQPCM